MSESKNNGLQITKLNGLILALKDTDWLVSKEASTNLVNFGKEAVPLLEAILKSSTERDETRRRAALILGQINDISATKALIDNLEAFDPDINWAVKTALLEITDKTVVKMLLEAFKNQGKSVILGLLVKLGNLDLEELIQALTSTSKIERADISRVLGNIGDLKAVNPLIKSLEKEEESLVQRTLIKSLAELGDKKAIEVIIRFLKDADAETRSTACVALATLGDSKIIYLLESLLKDEADVVKNSAKWAISAIENRQKRLDKIPGFEFNDWIIKQETLKDEIYSFHKKFYKQAMIGIKISLLYSEGKYKIVSYADSFGASNVDVEDETCVTLAEALESVQNLCRELDNYLEDN